MLRKSKWIKSDTFNKIKKFRSEGRILTEIADYYDVDINTIWSFCKKHNINKKTNLTKKQCKQCCICFETYYKMQQYCSVYCKGLGLKKYIKPPKKLKCSACGLILSVSKFYKNKSRPSGHSNDCRECRRKIKRNEEQKRLRNISEKKQRRNDLRFNLNQKMRVGIWQSIRQNKNGCKWENFVDYNIDQLRRRLKRTMPKGYTWQDFLAGELHIDHIIPKSMFNFRKPEHIDFKKCWALSNLQLLPAMENLKKCDKINKHFQPALKLAVG